MLVNLASVAMKFFNEWRSLFEEIGFAILDSSLVGSHCGVFSTKSSYISHPSFSSFFKNFPPHMVSRRVLFW